MKKLVKKRFGQVFLLVRSLGLDPLKARNNLRQYPLFLRDLRQVKRELAGQTEWKLGRIYPCLGNRVGESGNARGHYFHQDLLVARRIHERRPEKHVDVGSRIDGFVAHVAAFREIEVMDIRPLDTPIPGMTFVQADLMDEERDWGQGYCDSLSCLHALEHFGLGRYGDPITLDGYRVGFRNLTRIVKRGGTLYLSVPIGPQRIEFNAHRVFSLRHITDLWSEDFELKTFSYVDDRGDLHENVPLDDTFIDRNGGCQYGCGIFELIRRRKVGPVTTAGSEAR